MDFDTYWKKLVDRIYKEKETLAGPEERLYRLRCIYGKTMVDGIESYFERRHAEFQTDMDTLVGHGFGDVVDDFRQARELLFGDVDLTEESVVPVIRRLLDEDEADQPVLEGVNKIYDHLITRLPDVLDVGNQIGLDNGLFEAEP